MSNPLRFDPPALRKAAVALDLAARAFADLWQHAEERHPDWFRPMKAERPEQRHTPAGDYFDRDTLDASDFLAFAADVLDPERRLRTPASLPILGGESGHHVPGLESATAAFYIGRNAIGEELAQHDDANRSRLRRFLDGLAVGLANAWSVLGSGSTVEVDADALDADGPLVAAAEAFVDAALVELEGIAVE